MSALIKFNREDIAKLPSRGSLYEFAKRLGVNSKYKPWRWIHRLGLPVHRKISARGGPGGRGARCTVYADEFIAWAKRTNRL